VGEILSAVPLVNELKTLLPGASVIVTTGTETGQAVARKNFTPLGALVCYFPLDAPWAVIRYLDYLRPDLYISLDSDLWPNFLVQARRRGVSLALANARLSDKSFRRYLKYQRYAVNLIELMDVITCGSTLDCRRLQELGVSPRKLHFTGNLKVDRVLAGMDADVTDRLRELLNLKGEAVFLAASTHPGEDETVLRAYQTLLSPYPAQVLILAPRHPERAPDLNRLVQSRGLAAQLWSRIKSGAESRSSPVVIIDTIGDLFNLYGVADAAFVGGSLVPHGGQNILEAAAWGRAPIYGPHIHNFRWAAAILEEAGAGFTVTDAPGLAAAVRRLLDDPLTSRRLGAQAQAALFRQQGAARRQAEIIVKTWRWERN
jgi:3-deoxy-D-manno-octulosonic-acid transferase